MRKRIDLDANAGAPLLPAAREAMSAALDAGNPSSVHAAGRSARATVENARVQVAAAVGAAPNRVFFTSGATEAAALALAPNLLRDGARLPAGRLYVGATEHPCVLAGGRFPRDRVSLLSVDRNGIIDLDSLERALRAHDYDEGAPYLALMLANNETGVIHPVAEAARLVKQAGGVVFCDAVQAVGRITVDIAELGVDFLALSAHKIGGPQGAGALVLADEGVRPQPLLTGGGQERGARAGTENVAAIAGFGVAASLAQSHLSDIDRIVRLRARLESGILAVAPESRIAGRGAERLANTTMFVVPGMLAEIAVIAFDLDGIAVSAGSACSSGKVGPSHVLEAMGEAADCLRGGVRVSLPVSAGDAEVDGFLAAWRGIYERMRPARAA